MYKKISIGFLISLFLSCNQKQSDETKAVAADSLLVVPKTDSLAKITDTHYFWESVFDEKSKKMIMKKMRPMPGDSLTQENLISIINFTYPDIKIAFVKISGDTIFIKTINGNYLSKQMGSTGAETYLAEVVYNLTEIPNINFVHFGFKKGDHAGPGTYSRTDWIHPDN